MPVIEVYDHPIFKERPAAFAFWVMHTIPHPEHVDGVRRIEKVSDKAVFRSVQEKDPKSLNPGFDVTIEW